MGKGVFHTAGRYFCNFGLFLLGLAVVGQALGNLFYVQPFDHLLYLGVAFIMTFALCWMLRARARTEPATQAAGWDRWGSTTANE